MIYCYCGCCITDLNEDNVTLEEYASLVNNEENNFENRQLLKTLSATCPKKCVQTII